MMNRRSYDLKKVSAIGINYNYSLAIKPLKKNKIRDLLQVQKDNIFIYLLETINSTNDFLMKLDSKKKAIACIAEEQTGGYGSQGRKWQSPPRENIYLSMRYLLDRSDDPLSGLSLTIGLSICEAIESVCHLNQKLKIKWPNDVFAFGKKIAGILIETKKVGTNQEALIIGVGLNVNMLKTDRKIKQPWTSLYKIMGAPQDRNQLVAAMINSIHRHFKNFINNSNNGFKETFSKWRKRDFLLNKPVRLKVRASSIIAGTASGISREGLLIIKLDSGVKKSFSSGEVVLIKKRNKNN